MIEWLLVVLFFHTTLIALFTTWLWRKRAQNYRRQTSELLTEMDVLRDDLAYYRYEVRERA